MKGPLEQQSPEELIAYIKELRQEAQDFRERSEAYDEAFLNLSPGDQRGILHIVRLYAENPKDSAQLIRSWADSIEPPTTDSNSNSNTEQEEEMADDSNSNEAPPAWAQALVDQVAEIKKELDDTRQAQIDAGMSRLVTQAKELGYEQGTPEFDQLMEITSTNLANGDLKRAHEIMAATGLAPKAADAAKEKDAEGDAVEEPVVEEEAKSPRTAGKGGTPPAGGGESEEIDFKTLSWNSLKDVIRSREDSKAAADAGTATP